MVGSCHSAYGEDLDEMIRLLEREDAGDDEIQGDQTKGVDYE